MKMPAFFNKWISRRLQGRTRQCPEHPENKQSGKEQYGTDFRNTDKPLVAHRSWHNHIKNIHVMAREDYDTRQYNEPIDTFVITVH